MLSEGLLFYQMSYLKIIRKRNLGTEASYIKKLKARTINAPAFRLTYFKYSLIASLNKSILLK